ncbi:MAG TPA: tetratricopeptide repeat protein [Chitinivibrionales bacterium]|jgi:tetratricopeptide (TPR) repeat protein|nr:tetratricopeptide repeat protein [Chitinivibrionales bacterium]
MMRRNVLLCGALCALGIFAGRADCAPVNFWFEKANALYERQAYDSAAFYYEQILSSGFTNSAVYFNLGNSYYRLKKVGLALLAYERALRLSPNDPEIQANIRFANSAIIDRIPAPEKTFFEAVLLKLHTFLPLGAQLWLLFFLLLALGIMFAAGLHASPNARLWLIYLSSLVLLFGAAVGVSAGVKIYNSERVDYAVVLSTSLEAKNEPNGSKVIFTVHEGTKFRVHKTISDWSFVSLPTGLSGWVQSLSIGKI